MRSEESIERLGSPPIRWLSTITSRPNAGVFTCALVFTVRQMMAVAIAKKAKRLKFRICSFLLERQPRHLPHNSGVPGIESAGEWKSLSGGCDEPLTDSDARSCQRRCVPRAPSPAATSARSSRQTGLTLLARICHDQRPCHEICVPKSPKVRSLRHTVQTGGVSQPAKESALNRPKILIVEDD